MESQKVETTSADDTISAADSSPALNVLCSICDAFLRANDIVCNTNKCGHVFHKNCLTSWLDSSLTCPQCQTPCDQNLITRIYLNFAEATKACDETPSVTKFYKMDTHFEWVPMNLDEDSRTEDSHLTPAGALRCGVNEKGHPTYVARAYFNNDRLPAHYVPKEKVAYGGWDGHAYALTDGVEVLVLKDCDHEWVDGNDGSYPEDSLPTGYSHWGEVTYTGRGWHEGVLRLGKVHPSHKKMFVPHQDEEVGLKEYEVLVITPRQLSYS
ncbi:uncharacterized protein LOC108112370 [Drosophila eugracilis]|uniref:uncharacterized protein LOC108112370 n=1 Tax=Drosophila eugracilis TaxID=29029 RepID=UPI0007E8AD3D|nr:uncharacterized protein LOC108112370 [Drosophila eugracilis]